MKKKTKRNVNIFLHGGKKKNQVKWKPLNDDNRNHKNLEPYRKGSTVQYSNLQNQPQKYEKEQCQHIKQKIDCEYLFIAAETTFRIIQFLPLCLHS